MRRTVKKIADYLRISAVVRLLRTVNVRPSEMAGLISFAILFTLLESFGVSLLLPILQYAESGTTAITDSSNFYWTIIAGTLAVVGLEPTLTVLLALAFVPILLRQFVHYFKAWYSAATTSAIAMRMRAYCVDTILQADPEFFRRYPAGRLAGVIVNQAGTAGSAVNSVINQLSLAMLMAAYVGILLILSVPLTLIALVSVSIVGVAARLTMKRIAAFSRDSAEESQRMLGQVVERLGLMHLVKLRNREQAEGESIIRFTERMRRIGIESAKVSAGLEVRVDPLLMLSVFVTLYIGITVLGSSLAQLGLLLFVLNRLNGKVKEFNAGLNTITREVQSLHLMNEMLEDARRSNTIQSGTKAFTGLKRSIEFNDVTFAYPDRYDVSTKAELRGADVLKGINLTISAGSFVALVGRSGAGKSTLVELIPRLRDVSSGALVFDGVDVRDYEIGSLRRGVGYLTQSALLLNDTVAANLTYGLDREPTREEIVAAIEAAHAQFLLEFPQGLNTLVGPSGMRLSGGQRQRLAMARVFLQNTDILVFDEPTSALDSESEGYIQDAIQSMRGHKTVVVVAHRLATVIAADSLVVVDDGRIVERGTHSELVAAGGVYEQLFRSQLLR